MGQTYYRWSIYPRPLEKIHLEFHYKTMKHNFDCKLLYSDTDSLVYEVQTDNFFVDIELKQLKEMFDFSNFLKNHQQYDETNAKVTIKFTNEMAGRTVSEFVGLKPKFYSIKLSEGKHFFVFSLAFCFAGVEKNQ